MNAMTPSELLRRYRSPVVRYRRTVMEPATAYGKVGA